MKSNASRRATAVFGAGFAFLVMLVSGTMLAFAPIGRVAKVTDWALLGLGRDGWAAVHLSTAFLFAALAIWHILLHWPVIVNFTLGGPTSPRGHRFAALAMLALVAALLATAVLDLPPASWLVDLNIYFKQEFWAPAG